MITINIKGFLYEVRQHNIVYRIKSDNDFKSNKTLIFTQLTIFSLVHFFVKIFIKINIIIIDSLEILLF